MAQTKDKRKYEDRRDYLIEAVRKRRRTLRLKAITSKGGKCQVCGYSKCQEALEFHHIDEERKSFGISKKGYTRSWDKVKAEIEKCVLICANCHREIHARLAASNGNIRMKSG